MEIVAINGSPHENGNTAHAIRVVANELAKENIQTKIIHVGNQAIRGCIACGGCAKAENEKCVLTDSAVVNDAIAQMKAADGILLASPVYFAGMAGTMKAFLDRAFFVSVVNGNLFRHKVAGSLAVVRRSGGIEAVDQLNKYLNYGEFVTVNSNYWNVIHGMQPGEVMQDAEGVQIMEVLGKNMAWMLKMMEYGREKFPPPKQVSKVTMSFVR